mmetsp:Transcript_107/g.415  ORF Transcript_107/g.415 Transcript_107/m.415 type:complete len:399 (-) Transcript_107:404-1600(-)
MLSPPPPPPAALPDTELTHDVICTSRNVHQESLEAVLSEARPHQLLMPLFQRRYCWTRAQWAKLFSDLDAAGSAGMPVFLGRILAFVGPHDPRTLICDGQQRLLSVTLILAAVRDAALALADEALASEIDAVLFVDGSKRDTLMIVPTHDDRAAYAAALARPGEHAAPQGDGGPEGGSLMNAKVFFAAQVQAAMQRHHPPVAEGASEREQATANAAWRAKAASLARACLKMATFVRFGLDKGEELHRIFEQHATREQALKTIWNFNMPGMQVAACDLIRNLVFSCVPDEGEQAALHEAHWVEIERRATGGSGKAFDLESFFMAFLHTVGHSVSARPELYAGFRDWLAATVLADIDPEDQPARIAAIKGALEQMVSESKRWEDKVHQQRPPVPPGPEPQ